MQNEPPQISRENMDKWLVNPQKYEIVHARGCVRLIEFRKSFAADIVVMKNGTPLMLKSANRPLLAHEVLAERADLALDNDGNLLSQGDFNVRYEMWLGAFVYPEGTDIGAEPVPSVAAYVTECQDEYSESSGYVEIGFDPKLNQEWEPLEKFDADGNEIGKNADGDANGLGNVLAKMAMEKLSPEQVTEMMSEHLGKQVPIVGETEASETKVESATQSPEWFNAPCGKPCKSRAGLSAHIRHCANELCGGVSDNTNREISV